MHSNVRRYLEYASPTIGGVGAAYALVLPGHEHEFTNGIKNGHKLICKSLCQSILHISFVSKLIIFYSGVMFFDSHNLLILNYHCKIQVFHKS